jgi:hypothetical protein
MPKIACISNRFRNLDWKHIWLPHLHNVYEFPPNTDFYVFLGASTELLYHPEVLIKYREDEVIGVVIEGVSLHDRVHFTTAPLGFPYFSNEFFVLKNTKKAQDILDSWKETGEISETINQMKIKPIEYPKVVKIHNSLDAYPTIYFGDNE